jgi:hypothetical protein
VTEVTSVNSQIGAVVLTAADVGAIPSSAAGESNGVATLNSGKKLPEEQLPSSVASSSTGAAFPETEVVGITDRQESAYNAGTGHIIFADAPVLDPYRFGATVGGVYHPPPCEHAHRPLSELFGTLAEAQTIYTFATSLEQERDWAALQACARAMPTGENIQLNTGTPEAPSENYAVGGGGKIVAGRRKWYLGESALALPQNTDLGLDGTWIQYTGSKDAIVRLTFSTFAYWRCNITGAGVISSTWTPSEPNVGGRHGANILRMSDCTWGDILFFGFRDDAVVIAAGQWNDLRNVKALNCGGYAFCVGDGVELETELTEEISAGATTLPVAATAEVPTGKEVRIGSYYGEEVSYTGIEAHAITGCARGIHNSRARSWPDGTKVFIMQGQSSNDNHLGRSKGATCARGGIFMDMAHSNHCDSGTTMQFSGRATTTAEELTVPSELGVRSTIKLTNTEKWPSSGWFWVENEIITYETNNPATGELGGCLRGMKSTTAAMHANGVAARQGVGVHCRGGECMANTFDGHLEGNMWHAFVEAWNVTEESGMPRGCTIGGFFVASSKCERFVVNQGDGTLVRAWATQASIEPNLTRNGTRNPFESYTTTNQQLVTDQTGTSLEEGYEGRGLYLGGPLFPWPLQRTACLRTAQQRRQPQDHPYG